MSEQQQHLILIEQALRELEGDYQIGVREVQTWLKEKHGIDLPLEQVKGNIEIVRSLQQGEE